MAEGVTMLIKSLLTLMLFIHIFACVWMLLGDSSAQGWLTTKDEFKDRGSKYLHAYPAAFYFIVTTFTTVGYGEFAPSSDLEILLVMGLELLGLAIFSYTLGSIRSFERALTSEQLIERK